MKPFILLIGHSEKSLSNPSLHQLLNASKLVEDDNPQLILISVLLTRSSSIYLYIFGSANCLISMSRSPPTVEGCWVIDLSVALQLVCSVISWSPELPESCLLFIFEEEDEVTLDPQFDPNFCSIPNDDDDELELLLPSSLFPPHQLFCLLAGAGFDFLSFLFYSSYNSICLHIHPVHHTPAFWFPKTLFTFHSTSFQSSNSPILGTNPPYTSLVSLVGSSELNKSVQL